MRIVTGDDVKEACGSDQLCSGVEAGIEGSIHAITKNYQENCNDGWGLFVG